MGNDQQNKVKDKLADAIKEEITHKSKGNYEYYFVALFFSIIIIVPLCLIRCEAIPWSNVCVFSVAVMLLIALIVAYVKRSKYTSNTDYYRFLSHVATILRDVMQEDKLVSCCDEVKTKLEKLESDIAMLRTQVEKRNSTNQ